MSEAAMTTAADWRIDDADLRAWLAAWCTAMTAAADELNALDGRLGDGDLGTTLSRCADQIRAVLGAPAVAAAPWATTLKACAQGCAKASGSSFGTLLAVAFLAAARSVGDAAVLQRQQLGPVLAAVQDALCARGGAAPGDKTMIDSLAAIAAAIAAAPPAASRRELADAAHAAAEAALRAYRDRPNRIGRARMFAERSVGLDDPGMVAVARMTAAL